MRASWSLVGVHGEADGAVDDPPRSAARNPSPVAAGGHLGVALRHLGVGQDAELPRARCGRDTAVDIELLEDVGDVAANRLLADEQPHGELLVRQSLGQQLEAPRPRGWVSNSVSSAPAKPPHHAESHPRTAQRAPPPRPLQWRGPELAGRRARRGEHRGGAPTTAARRTGRFLGLETQAKRGWWRRAPRRRLPIDAGGCFPALARLTAVRHTRSPGGRSRRVQQRCAARSSIKFR